MARPGQSGTFVFKSTGGFAQVEWSPCTVDIGYTEETEILKYMYLQGRLQRIRVSDDRDRSHPLNYGP